MTSLELPEHLCQDEEDSDRIVRRSIAISLKRIADRLDSWNGQQGIQWDGSEKFYNLLRSDPARLPAGAGRGSRRQVDPPDCRGRLGYQSSLAGDRN